MKRICSIGLLISVVALSTAAAAGTLENSVVYKAMKDELARTQDQLKMDAFAGPYYVAYRVDEEQTRAIVGSFGAIQEDSARNERQVHLDLRVGDYKLDNSNFMPEDMGALYRNAHATLPLEDDYDAIRHALWLATDKSYKTALEMLAKKKAVIENKMIAEHIDDFSKATATTHEEALAKIELDSVKWLEAVRKVSALFKKYPAVQTSKVYLRTSAHNLYFLDSEGSSNLRGDLSATLEITAIGQKADGLPLQDYKSFQARTSKELLAQLPEIEKEAAALADNLTAETKAGELDSYVGPVLFTDSASAQLFYQVLGQGVSDPKQPLYENEMMAKYAGQENVGFLAGKIGHKIMPASYSVVDDPTLREWNGKPLVGGFAVDDQGVKAQKVSLVENGQLKGFLMSRSPTKKITASNGHARVSDIGLVQAKTTNLIVKSDKGVNDKKLKKQFLAMCKDRGLKYGIVVSRLSMDLPWVLRDNRMRMFFFGMGGGEEKPPLLSSPLYAYKLYTDGEKIEALPPLAFDDVSYRILKDITQQGNEAKVCNMTINDDTAGVFNVSVVAPPLIIDEMELSAATTKPTKLPLLTHPFFMLCPFFFLP